ncbi:MAG: saccharopine dehydrogenase NADP-binding domain-containing protein [Bacteroidetes bacterium]|nr:saccharopine dehydrogenase NADP-binding domain-containing protein [Bacteroidota bacterium]
MKKIFVIGAGRSATNLIEYLLEHAAENQWKVIVGDYNEKLARQKVGDHPSGEAIFFDANDAEKRQQLIASSALVVSFLPAHMHLGVARDCLKLGAHLVTASYLTRELEGMNEAVKAKGLVFLNEMGADPGIDHMSAMRSIDEIREKGGKLTAFKSYCGALVAPESNDNPWGYKFTWSPMNLILAGGQSAAKFIENGKYHYIPYHRLFSTTETIEVSGAGTFEAYANRDSVIYREKYGLQDLPTMFRATLRVPGFCEAWNSLVKLGITDPNYEIHQSDQLTYREWVEAYLPTNLQGSMEEKLAAYLDTPLNSPLMGRLEWAGLLSDQHIIRKKGTPAEILLDLLLEKFKLGEEDKDMLVMVDKFEYEWEGKKICRTSSMVTKGIDPLHTAISRTVGLPAAIGAKLILQGKVQQKGVQMPVNKEVYGPVLDELAELGISFMEEEWVE